MDPETPTTDEASLWPQFSADITSARSVARSITLDTHRATADRETLTLGAQLEAFTERLVDLERELSTGRSNERIATELADRFLDLRTEVAEAQSRFEQLLTRVSSHEEEFSASMLASLGGFDDRLGRIEDTRLSQSDDLNGLMTYVETAFTAIDELKTAIEVNDNDDARAQAETTTRIDELVGEITDVRHRMEEEVAALELRRVNSEATFDDRFLEYRDGVTEEIGSLHSRLDETASSSDERIGRIDERLATAGERAEGAHGAVSDLRIKAVDVDKRIGDIEARAKSSDHQVASTIDGLSSAVDHALGATAEVSARIADHAEAIDHELTERIADARESLEERLASELTTTNDRIDANAAHAQEQLDDTAHALRDETAANDARITEQDEQLRQYILDNAQHLDSIEGHVDAVDERVGGVEARLAEQVGGVRAGVAEQVGGVESRLAEYVNGVEALVAEHVTGIDSRVGEQVAAAESRAVARSDEVEARVIEQVKKSEAHIAEQVGGIEARTAEQSERALALNDQVDTIAERLAGDSARIDAGTERLAGLEAQVADVAGIGAEVATRTQDRIAEIVSRSEQHRNEVDEFVHREIAAVVETLDERDASVRAQMYEMTTDVESGMHARIGEQVGEANQTFRERFELDAERATERLSKLESKVNDKVSELETGMADSKSTIERHLTKSEERVRNRIDAVAADVDERLSILEVPGAPVVAGSAPLAAPDTKRLADIERKAAAAVAQAAIAQEFTENLRILQAELVRATQAELARQSDRIADGLSSMSGGAPGDGRILALEAKVIEGLEAIDELSNRQRESSALDPALTKAVRNMTRLLEQNTSEIAQLKTELVQAHNRIAHLENPSAVEGMYAADPGEDAPALAFTRAEDLNRLAAATAAERAKQDEEPTERVN
ncbi:MAG: hypothetical protein ACR2P0_19875 [Acidimicrobiales bacterium]